jgi:hypothetical protein
MPIIGNEISEKIYFCPLCGHEEKHNTNHYGEIYTVCPNCKSIGLYCKGVTRLVVAIGFFTFYEFRNLDEDKDQIEAYKQFVHFNRMCGVSKNIFQEQRSSIAINIYREHAGTEIDVYEIMRGSNQYSTKIGRLHSYSRLNVSKISKCAYQFMIIKMLV